MKILAQTVCLLAGTLSGVAMAGDDTEPPTYTSTCSEVGTEMSCLKVIDTNAGQDNYNSKAIYDLLTGNFAFGSSSFYGSTTPSDDSTSTDLTNIIQGMEYYSVAGGFSTHLVPWLGSSSSTTQSTISATDDNSDDDFTTTVNTISASNSLYGGGEGASGIASTDYYSASDSIYNSGTSQVEYLDVKPVSFPPSARIIRNELGQQSMTQFLIDVGDASSIDSDKATSWTTSCPAYAATTDDDNTYYGIDGADKCYTPYVQMNVASYNPSSTYSDTSTSSYSLSVPTFDQFFKGNIDTAVLPSLNADSLLSPLTYSSSVNSQLSTDRTERHQNLGLYGDSELGMADSFIRYVSGSLIPNSFVTRDTYDNYYTLATEGKCLQYRLDAALKIKTYRQLLRYYAAQKSVGASNLYYLMAKRMPNSGLTNSRSQAEEEARMATYRIFPTTTKDGKTQAPDWQKRLQQASGAEIQRQIATLLAEINYQLYVTRKEQERILMTMSVMQLDALNQNKQALTMDNAQSYVSSISASSSDSCGSASTEVGED